MGVTVRDSALADFLNSTDLDALLAAREALESVDEDDERDVAGVLDRWEDGQAIANLLMYPEVVPDDVRVGALVRGLTAPAGDYQALAATVGVQHLADLGALSHPERNRLAPALLALLVRGDGLVTERAHIAVLALTKGASPEPLVQAALADGALTVEQAEGVSVALAGPLPSLAALPSYQRWATARR